jgi:hypothetical protein
LRVCEDTALAECVAKWVLRCHDIHLDCTIATEAEPIYMDYGGSRSRQASTSISHSL